MRSCRLPLCRAGNICLVPRLAPALVGNQSSFHSSGLWRFGHHGQCAVTARAAIGKIWVKNAKQKKHGSVLREALWECDASSHPVAASLCEALACSNGILFASPTGRRLQALEIGTALLSLGFFFPSNSWCRCSGRGGQRSSGAGSMKFLDKEGLYVLKFRCVRAVWKNLGAGSIHCYRLSKNS